MSLEQLKTNKIFWITSIVAIILAIIIVKMAMSSITPKQVDDDEINISVQSRRFKTMKELLEYYGCTYISENIAMTLEGEKELYLKFNTDLYANGKSNEEFFMSIIQDVANFYGYYSFNMYDAERDITVEVKCVNRRINKIIINGLEDYFRNRDAMLAEGKYVEYPTTTLAVNSQILQKLIDNNWSSDAVGFGSKESIYNKYDVYYDEGIRVRVENGKVYNIVFTEKFGGEVVDGIVPGTGMSTIRATIGTPTFEDGPMGIIGYKTKKYYVFFSENEISVYRIYDASMVDFIALYRDFKNDNIDLLELMNKLTEKWPDYDIYEYTSNSVFISYPLQGLDIKINYDNQRGIIFYNNFNYSRDTVMSMVDADDDLVSKLGVDGVFEGEKRRINTLKDLNKKADEFEKDLAIKSNLYKLYIEKDIADVGIKAYFISKDGSLPNRELNDTISTFTWINDTYFVYSKYGRGIYLYDLSNARTQTLVEGKQEFNIKSFENNTLKYDNDEVNLEF